jgi:TfoX/Sxy family transcriptional regulator of competence genes
MWAHWQRITFDRPYQRAISHFAKFSMATKQTTIDLILSQLAAAGDVSAKKMFGDYGLFLRGRMIAIVGDDKLFIKPTEKGRTLCTGLREVSPYPDAKPCFLNPSEKWSDREWLGRLAGVTGDEIPLPKTKKKN